MTRQAFGRLVLPAVLLALVASAGAFAGERRSSTEAGRYKKQGNQCLWDANDNGPDQCSPVTKGHFKKSGDSCTWDANETGTDQCKPDKGRFKKEGTACVWNATDSGPNQCNPRDVK